LLGFSFNSPDVEGEIDLSAIPANGDSSMANAVTDASFEQEVLKSSEPVLVDFHATWCGPCKAMAPALDQVAKEMAGKVKVVKVDVDENPAITGQYGIRAMPTLLIFKGGKVAAQHTGAIVQKKKLEDWINSSVTAEA
jgi:thioredoxin 1